MNGIFFGNLEAREENVFQRETLYLYYYSRISIIIFNSCPNENLNAKTIF